MHLRNSGSVLNEIITGIRQVQAQSIYVILLCKCNYVIIFLFLIQLRLLSVELNET